MRLPELERIIDRLDYPTTTVAIVREHGELQLDFQEGTERIGSLLERVGPEVFSSPDELRMTLYGALPEGAVGRKGYSDRDPPGVDEVEPVSF